MRTHAKSLLGFKGKDYQTMARLNRPYTDDEIAAYERDDTPSYFATRKLRVDFTRPLTGFALNLEAHDYFVRHLLHDFQGGAYKSAGVPAHYINEDHIGAAFSTYMATCRDQYRLISSPPDKAKADRRKQRLRQNSRKNTVRLHAEDSI